MNNAVLFPHLGHSVPFKNTYLEPSLYSDGSQLLRPPVGRQTYQDCVRHSDALERVAQTPSPQTLAKPIVGGWQSKSIFTNGCISFVMHDHTQYYEEPTYFNDQSYAGSQSRCYFRPAGMWCNYSTGETGFGILSLIGKILGCEFHSAQEWFARECGISLDDCDVSQMSIASQDCFIETPYTYGPMSQPVHPILGQPHKWCWFTTEFAQNSFGFCQWVIDAYPVGLFCSLVFDANSKMPEWKFVRPPAAAMIFNKHRIRQEPTLPIMICDTLELAAEFKDHQEYVTTWSGGKEHVSMIDWQLLAGRDVTYVMSEDHPDTYKTCHMLHEAIRRVGADFKVDHYDA